MAVGTALLAAAPALCLAGAAPMPSFPLQNAADPGQRFPVVGLGTGGYGDKNGTNPECWWESCDGGVLARDAIKNWLQLGGRRIDDADSYFHQNATGAALRESGVERQDIYYLSKVGPSNPLGYSDIMDQSVRIQRETGTDYVDMLLIHWPTGGSQGTIQSLQSSDPLCNTTATTFDEKGCRISSWRALVTLWKNGFARAIGVSNYNVTHIREIADSGLPLPSVNQVPYNPHRYQSHAELEQLCRGMGIMINGYSPLGVPDLVQPGGSRGHHVFPKSVGAPSLLDEQVVKDIAAKWNATAAQVLIAWSVGIGVPVQPRTKNVQHMKENLAAATLQLDAADLVAVGALAEDTCDEDPHWYECAPTATHCPPQCCDTAPCKTDSMGNCCATGGQ
eukprot:TRINITY_DN2513_c0_g1_i1.p1 TRINITY_DN2513_c0_g1~~TRINITY_DN2513_c0_g1_i1.p1  ORF type:complete len:392 (+),score=112.40 TRINITY_DN2513_c0_g1_i1:68-1243(+)